MKWRPITILHCLWKWATFSRSIWACM